ncbi:MAG: hypothetical protein WCK73_13945 [Deltaproteobacteria bacterium]
MPTYLPIPLAYWPRTSQDLATVGERLGGRASLHVATTKVVRQVKGESAPRPVPEFIEWWLEYPAEFIPLAPPPPEPADPVVRDALIGLARIAAHGWAKEAKLAKGWPPEPQLASPGSTGTQAPFVQPTTRRGSK